MFSFHPIQLEGTILLNANGAPDETDSIQTRTVDILLEHKNDDNVLHRLFTAIVVQNENEQRCSVKCNQINANVSVVHTNGDGQLWTVNHLLCLLSKVVEGFRVILFSFSCVREANFIESSHCVRWQFMRSLHSLVRHQDCLDLEVLRLDFRPSVSRPWVFFHWNFHR